MLYTFIFIISTIKDIKIHPMNFFFLAAAFFAFHLIFSYTVDHLNIYLAFVLPSSVADNKCTPNLRTRSMSARQPLRRVS